MEPSAIERLHYSNIVGNEQKSGAIVVLQLVLMHKNDMLSGTGTRDIKKKTRK